ncbi:hypothetical protein KAH27_02125 [bacterium]|nr:hypothetical protein [bacterium]
MLRIAFVSAAKDCKEIMDTMDMMDMIDMIDSFRVLDYEHDYMLLH